MPWLTLEQLPLGLGDDDNAPTRAQLPQRIIDGVVMYFIPEIKVGTVVAAPTPDDPDRKVLRITLPDDPQERG